MAVAVAAAAHSASIWLTCCSSCCGGRRRRLRRGAKEVAQVVHRRQVGLCRCRCAGLWRLTAAHAQQIRLQPHRSGQIGPRKATTPWLAYYDHLDLQPSEICLHMQHSRLPGAEPASLARAPAGLPLLAGAAAPAVVAVVAPAAAAAAAAGLPPAPAAAPAPALWLRSPRRPHPKASRAPRGSAAAGGWAADTGCPAQCRRRPAVAHGRLATTCCLHVLQSLLTNALSYTCGRVVPKMCLSCQSSMSWALVLRLHCECSDARATWQSIVLGLQHLLRRRPAAGRGAAGGCWLRCRRRRRCRAVAETPPCAATCRAPASWPPPPPFAAGCCII